MGGLTLLTDDFATATQNTEPGVDVILSRWMTAPAPTPLLTIGRQTQYVVEQVRVHRSIPIPRQAVLT